MFKKEEDFRDSVSCSLIKWRKCNDFVEGIHLVFNIIPSFLMGSYSSLFPKLSKLTFPPSDH